LHDRVSIVAAADLDVTPESAGAALHAAYLAEARIVVSEVLYASPSTPEELAAVVDAVSGGELDEETLSVMVDVLGG
jgi:hypothetical protein